MNTLGFYSKFVDQIKEKWYGKVILFKIIGEDQEGKAPGFVIQDYGLLGFETVHVYLLLMSFESLIQRKHSYLLN